jgi:NADH-quinone oxidoreductase subunit A
MREYFPILLQVLIVLGFGATVLAISVLFGKAGKRTAAKDMPYECGMIPQGEGQPRFSVKFYLIAMLFILFDIEVVFLYPWAVNFKTLIVKNGAMIFWSMTGFLALVTVGYVYAIKKGVLDWKRN